MRPAPRASQVDSGTSFVFASTPVFRALVDHLQRTTPQLSQRGNKKCGWLTSRELDAMPQWHLVVSWAAIDPSQRWPPVGRLACPTTSATSRARARAHLARARVAPLLERGRASSLARPWRHPWQFAAQPDRPLLVKANQYMVEHPPSTSFSPTSRYYCATIFDNGRAGTVIGASIMRQREVRRRPSRRHK